MLAAWRAGKCSSVCARELGNGLSAYSPHPGSTRLSGRHRAAQTTSKDQTKSRKTMRKLCKYFKLMSASSQRQDWSVSGFCTNRHGSRGELNEWSKKDQVQLKPQPDFTAQNGEKRDKLSSCVCVYSGDAISCSLTTGLIATWYCDFQVNITCTNPPPPTHTHTSSRCRVALGLRLRRWTS